METVLLTGGAGFIGSNIADALIENGYRVVILDDLSTGKMENIRHLSSNGRCRFVEGSILDGELMRRLILSEDISLVSHQAAIPSVVQSIEDPVSTTEVNVTGFVKLIKSASEGRCKRIVFASSCAVYGDISELPLKEYMPMNPKSPYASSKAAMEMHAVSLSYVYRMDIVGLRYFNVYGRRQDPSSHYSAVIPIFATKSLRDESIIIDGDGLQTRDFVFIDDVVDANIKALTTDALSSKVFNIASGKQTTILELARLTMEITGTGSEINYTEPRLGDVRDSLADIELAKKYLDYKPMYDIRRGLIETVKWFKAQ